MHASFALVIINNGKQQNVITRQAFFALAIINGGEAAKRSRQASVVWGFHLL